MEIENVKFQYDYLNREEIENCKEKCFRTLTIESNEKKSFILYGDRLYRASFEEDKTNIIIEKTISKAEKEKIIREYDFEEYTAHHIYKVYTGINYGQFDYIKKNTIRILNVNNGFFINPKINIDSNQAVIFDEGIIGTINDPRSITLVKSITAKDIIIINDDKMQIFTLKSINRKLSMNVDNSCIRDELDDEKFIITILSKSEKYDDMVKLIKRGCRVKNELWLFYIDNKSDERPEEIVIQLADNKYCFCNFSGNELIIKKIINKPMSLKGLCSLIVRNIDDVIFRNKDEQNDDYDENMIIKNENKKESDFMKSIKRYQNIENIILEKTKQEIKELKYINIENNRFIIDNNYYENMEKWNGREGMPVILGGREKQRNIVIGNLIQVGDNFIDIDFRSDLIRASIAKKNGYIAFSFIGDETMQKRRKEAQKIVDTDSAPINYLKDILSETYEYNTFSYDNCLKKSQYDNLTPKQIDAVDGALNTKDIFIIQGPPGTGKTSVIRKISEKLIQEGKEVLISSFQNLAVDNVLEGFKGSSVIPYRFGNEDNTAMLKICSDFIDEVNSNLQSNASWELEERINNIKDELNDVSNRIINECDDDKSIKLAEEALEVIRKYEGDSFNVDVIIELISRLKKNSEIDTDSFDFTKIEEMMPEAFDYDIEVIDKLEEIQKTLEKAAFELKNKKLLDISSSLKSMIDIDNILGMDDEKYQKFKSSMIKSLRLASNTDSCVNANEKSRKIKYELVKIIDNVIQHIPDEAEDEMYAIVKDFYERINNNPLLMEEVLKKHADIRGTTCQKTLNSRFIDATKNIDYDYVIIDETARANPLDLLIPMIKGRKIILVGDHKQLPHMLETYIEEEFKNDEDYVEEEFNKYIKESLFGRLYNSVPDNRKIMLDTQFRMTKEIGDLVSDLFYDGKLKTGTDITNDTFIYNGHSLIMENIRGKERKDYNGSFYNEKECDEIIKKLIIADELYKDKDEKPSIGIITFYKSQAMKLQRKINSLNLTINAEAGTVDAYQGLEKDIIFLSTVRTDGIGFISNSNRLNVALSRAKKLVVIFGDKNNISRNKLMKKITDRCTEGSNFI